MNVPTISSEVLEDEITWLSFNYITTLNMILQGFLKIINFLLSFSLG